MRRSIALLLCSFATASVSTAYAQEGGQQTAPANTPYIAPTGKTVPRPGDLPNGGNTGGERTDSDRKADKITGGICKGC